MYVITLTTSPEPLFFGIFLIKLAQNPQDDYNTNTMTDEFNKNTNNDDAIASDLEASLEEIENIEHSSERAEHAEDAEGAHEQEDSEDIVVDEDVELGPAETIKKLRAKLKTAVEEKQQYLNGWQKDKAEFINARKRDDEAKQEFLKFAKQGVLEDILPVLDSFDMAMGKNGAEGNAQAQAWESVSKEWRAGVEGIYNQLVAILSKNDVSIFGAVGEAFDPNLHHSIGLVSTEDATQDHKVAEVMQRGYMLGGKVVRPAMVKVWEV